MQERLFTSFGDLPKEKRHQPDITILILRLRIIQTNHAAVQNINVIVFAVWFTNLKIANS